MPTAPVQKGDLLAGKYRVDGVLGAGGMGVVVAAHHIHLDEKVAIKFLWPDMLGNREAVERFAREARAAVKIKSEYVARVSDVGSLENGAPYMVMEYLEGQDLAAWLEERGPLPLEQAVELTLQACEALAEAHGLGIVHRDLKPANLYAIRRADGLLCTKVLDFGISKATRLGGSGPDLFMTRTSALIGSPLYMSPEQLESAKYVDARTDIWALGATLYELLTGRRPFEADTLPELVVQILSRPPQPLLYFRPALPAQLEPVVLRCLEKARDARYRNVAELATALQPFGPDRARVTVERVSQVIQAAGLVRSATRFPLSSHRQLEPLAGTVAAWGPITRRRERPRRSVIIATAGALLLGVGALFYVFRHGAKPRTPPASEVPRRTAATTRPPPPKSAEPVSGKRASALSASRTADLRVLPDPKPLTSAKPPATSGAKPSVKPAPAKGDTSRARAKVTPTVSSEPPPAPLVSNSRTIFDDRK
jgi:serine/threonine-protein kinase